MRINKAIMAIRARLLAIPVKLAPMLVGIENPREIQPILKDEVYAALTELASEKFSHAIHIDVVTVLKKYEQFNNSL